MNECVLIFSNEVAAGQQRWMALHYNLPKPAANLLLPTLFLLPLIEAWPLFCYPDPLWPLLPPLFLPQLNCADPFLQPLSLPIFPPCPLNPRRYHPSISYSRYRPVWERRKKKGGTVKLLWSLGCNEKVFNAFPSFKWQGGAQRKIPQSWFNGTGPGESDDVLNTFWQGHRLSSSAIFQHNISHVSSPRQRGINLISPSAVRDDRWYLCDLAEVILHACKLASLLAG